MELIKWAFLIGGPAFVFWSCWKETKRHDQP